MTRDDALHVCIDARLVSGTAGGVETVVVGLAQGFHALADPGLRLSFLVYRGEDAWLRPHLHPDWDVVEALPPSGLTWVRRLGPLAPVVRAAYRRVRALRPVPAVTSPAHSDGTLEASGADLVHFPFQDAFLTAVPSIYQPHDLQHRHLPQFFTEEQRAWRDGVYAALCEQAAVVVVGTSWVKQDLVEQMGVPEQKIRVVPLAPVSSRAEGAGAAQAGQALRALGLPERFVLYPAAAWPHKNHARLLSAIAHLRSAGLDVPLVCTGAHTEHEETLRRQVKELGIEDLVVFAGFLGADDLARAYRAAAAVVVPTLFEAASYPVWEAFRAGTPVACSDVTSLPAQAGGAALVFDPLDVQAIASAVRRLWEDQALAAELADKGRERVASFTVEATAAGYAAVYRLAAGRPLSERDRALLDAPAPL